MQVNTVSSLTGKAYTLIRTGHGYEPREVPPDAGCALPLVPFGGPYYYPFAKNPRHAAICLTRAKTLRVHNVNYDLANPKARAHKKAFRHYARQVCVCDDSHHSVECHPELPRINGKPVFIQETAHYHWPESRREYNEPTCRICSNRTKKDQSGRRLMVSRNSRKLLHCHVFLCLRCCSLLSFGHWPDFWEGTCLGDTSLGQRHYYEFDSADISGILATLGFGNRKEK